MSPDLNQDCCPILAKSKCKKSKFEFNILIILIMLKGRRGAGNDDRDETSGKFFLLNF